MKRARLWRLAVVVAVLLIGQVTAVQAQDASAATAADCQFVLGFATLKALIDAAEGPEKVGECLENERHNPAKGETLQQTTGGLLVWRKADNWTAFTDGYRTWANGPYGLQRRLNTEEFPWERPAPTTLYWTDTGTNKIQRANLDGSQVEDVLTGLSVPVGLALDVAAGKLYWTHAGFWSDTGTGEIQRANLDGSHVEDLVTAGLSALYGLALDVTAGKLYWVDAGTRLIQRANLDGSEVEDVVTTDLGQPYGLALDVAAGKLYWVDAGTRLIQRANLDGSQVEDVVTGLDDPGNLAVDVRAGKLYWVDWDRYAIQRANLDGSQMEDVVTRATGGLRVPEGIVVGPR